jgi:(aminoalkyl)phosphonate N-acetyltransferase
VTVTVREALPGDFEAVAALLEELNRPKVLGTPDEDRHRQRYVAWLEGPDRLGFVAEIDGEVIGFIDLHLVPRLNFTAPQAWVPDLIVRESARSRGAGAALLAKAEEAARARGAFVLSLESAHWRSRAHAFYLREGLLDAGKEFAKVLIDVGWPPRRPSSA